MRKAAPAEGMATERIWKKTQKRGPRARSAAQAVRPALEEAVEVAAQPIRGLEQLGPGGVDRAGRSSGLAGGDSGSFANDAGLYDHDDD
jgi:hypothetical protein